jgi:hypothetical protein
MVFIGINNLQERNMLHHIKKLFGIKPKAVETEAPYKVEAPVEPTPVAVQATEAMVESVAPAKKARKPRAPKVDKAPAVKKPRAPRKPKAE